MSPASARGNGALILVVLIALVIILVMMFGNFGGTSYVQQVSNTRKKGIETARDINTGQLSLLIAQYREANKALPRTWEELEAPSASYTDHWGKPMSFSFETDNRTGATKVTYRSDGPDGLPNTEDDITRTEPLPY